MLPILLPILVALGILRSVALLAVLSLRVAGICRVVSVRSGVGITRLAVTLLLVTLPAKLNCLADLPFKLIQHLV